MRKDAGKMSPIFCGTYHHSFCVVRVPYIMIQSPGCPACEGLYACRDHCLRGTLQPTVPYQGGWFSDEGKPFSSLRFWEGCTFLLSSKLLLGDSEEQCRHNYGCSFKVLRAPEFPPGKLHSLWCEEELSNSISGNSGLGDQKTKTFV